MNSSFMSLLLLAAMLAAAVAEQSHFSQHNDRDLKKDKNKGKKKSSEDDADVLDRVDEIADEPEAAIVVPVDETAEEPAATIVVPVPASTTAPFLWTRNPTYSLVGPGQGGSAGGQDEDRTIGDEIDGTAGDQDEDLIAVDEIDGAADGEDPNPITGDEIGGAAGGQDEDLTVADEIDGSDSTGDSSNLAPPQVASRTPDGVVFEDGKTLTFGGLFEFFPCVSFDEAVVQEKAADFRGDVRCAANSCPGGCCREMDFHLLCDEANNYPNRECVCNDNTFSRSSPVAVAPPPTPSPVAPVPTPSPVTPSPTLPPVTPGPTLTPVTPGPTFAPVTSVPTPPPVAIVTTSPPVVPATTTSPVFPIPTSQPVSVPTDRGQDFGGSGQGGAGGGQNSNRTVVDDLADPVFDGNTTGRVDTNTTITNSTDLDTDTDTPERIPVYPDEDFCFPNFAGQDWGIYPQDTSTLPEGTRPGDCTSNSHCLPTSLPGETVCCLKHLCICRLYNTLDDCRP